MSNTPGSGFRGRRAVVIGAGLGGLTAARALADHFEQVTVIERDQLPSEPTQRAGIPQGRHAHALLGGGQRALEELFPGFVHDLAGAGAVPYRVGLDNWLERPGTTPFRCAISGGWPTPCPGRWSRSRCDAAWSS